MPSFKQKNVIKSYKLRLQQKLKAVTDETENVTTYLNNRVSEFRDRVQHILDIKDEKCLSLYKKLIRDLENYSESLYILQTSLEGSEEDSDSQEDEISVAEEVKNQSTNAAAYQTPKNENCFSDFQNQEIVFNLPEHAKQTEYHNHLKKHSVIQRHSTEDVNFSLPQVTEKTEYHNRLEKYFDSEACSVENVESLDSAQDGSYEETLPKKIFNLPTYQKDNTDLYDKSEVKQKYSDENDDGSITEDDFHSLHSYNVQSVNIDALQPQVMRKYDNENILANAAVSSISVSQSSCYHSISSNLSESSASHQAKNTRPSEISTYNEHPQKSPNFVINPPNFQISSTFSGNISFVIDPSDFWIQLENSHGTALRFPKSKYAHHNSLSSIAKGHYCLAPFRSTSFYYRAQSLSDAESAEKFIKVLFIDHGSVQDISLKDLRPLPSYAFEIPAQAINCYLYGIAPATDSWSDKAIERFKEFQNFCIETTIRSRENLYGVQLVTKLSEENFSEDFSVNIAGALCLDAFAISLQESPLYDLCQNEPMENQPSDVLCNKVDLSLDELDLSNVNAISSDSGVSFSSSHKSEHISKKRNELFNEVSKDCISAISMSNSASSHDENFNKFDKPINVSDLISFESNKDLCDIQNAISSTDESLSDYCTLCRSKNFCLHLKIPSPTLFFVKQNMVIVMLSHIVNPHEIYLNMAMENIVHFDDLRDQMNSLYQSGKVHWNIKVSDLTENMFCAGRFSEDNYWYRVKILRINDESTKRNEVLVQYIDYGNTALMKCCDLKPLTHEFSKHPIFAIKCSLAGVSSTQGENNWSEDAINCFKKLVSVEKPLTAQICSKLQDNSNDVYSVLLWDTDGKNDVLINELLADHKVAVFDHGILQSLPPKQGTVASEIDTWDPMLEEYIDSQNSYDIDDEDIEIVTTGYHAKDEMSTCKYFSLRGYCPRGSNCQYQHVPLLESGVTRDQEEVYCLDTMPIMSEAVNNVLVLVSAIISPSHFYVVLPFGCKTVNDIDNLVYKGSSYDKITNSEAKALFYAMNKHYSSAPFKENTSIALSCGTIVAAKRKWDEKWHRGRIIDIIDIDKPAKIFFVDSGDCEWVPRKLIRTILPHFLYTPFQAVQCSLQGVVPAGLTWSSEAIKYFKEVVDGEILLAEVIIRFGEAFQVSLRRTSQNDHRSVQQNLVLAGFANFLEVTQQSSLKEMIYMPG